MKGVAVSLIAGALFVACTQRGQNDGEIKPPPVAVAIADSLRPNNALAVQPRERNNRNGIETRSLGGHAYTIVSMGQVPEGDAQRVVRDLRKAALAGNAKASYGLYLKVRECVDMMNRYETRGSASITSSTYEACRNLDAENYENAAAWLDLAASQGHLGAQLLYAADPEATLGGPAEMLKNPYALTRYKEKSMRYLMAAATGGNVEALLGLGNAYRVGVLTDTDLVSSYAYYQAVEKIDPRFIPQASMEVLRKEMTQQQIELSRAKGMEIHDGCCSEKQRSVQSQ